MKDLELEREGRITRVVYLREAKTVKVFISWSGEPSRSIARALYEWLPSVVQHVQPWMSDHKIETGRRWNEEIAKALDDTDYGVVCVTAENQHAPWLMFEAGGLAKRLDVARVVPLRIDMTNVQLKEPMASFEGVELTKEGMQRLVRDIMALRADPLLPDRVDEIVEDAWPRLEKRVQKAKQNRPELATRKLTTDEVLEEIVVRVRRIDRQTGSKGGIIIGGAREATEEEQAAIDRHREEMGPSNPFPGLSESDDV